MWSGLLRPVVLGPKTVAMERASIPSPVGVPVSKKSNQYKLSGSLSPEFLPVPCASKYCVSLGLRPARRYVSRMSSICAACDGDVIVSDFPS